jgi:hypothetical protein
MRRPEAGSDEAEGSCVPESAKRLSGIFTSFELVRTPDAHSRALRGAKVDDGSIAPQLILLWVWDRQPPPLDLINRLLSTDGE